MNNQVMFCLILSATALILAVSSYDPPIPTRKVLAFERENRGSGVGRAEPTVVRPTYGVEDIISMEKHLIERSKGNEEFQAVVVTNIIDLK